MSLLEAREVTVTTKGLCLLDRVSCVIAQGRMVGICGPNGAGKSTLLRALAGLQHAEGEIRLAGRPLQTYGASERALWLGYLPQQTEAAWPISVRELVGLGRFPHAGEAAAVTSQSVSAALTRLQLTGLASRLLDTLSGGERTRAHLARLLAGGHRFILADEPTAALDPGAQLEVLGLLRGLAGDGIGLGIVLHDLPLAARFCDSLVLLAGGKPIADGAPDAVLSDAHLARVFNVEGIRDPVSGALAGFKSRAAG